MLEFNIEEFQPTGSLSTYKKKPDSEEEMKMPVTPLREMYNLQRHIQHEMAQFHYGHMSMNLIIHFLSLIGHAKQEQNV